MYVSCSVSSAPLLSVVFFLSYLCSCCGFLSSPFLLSWTFSYCFLLHPRFFYSPVSFGIFSCAFFHCSLRFCSFLFGYLFLRPVYYLLSFFVSTSGCLHPHFHFTVLFLGLSACYRPFPMPFSLFLRCGRRLLLLSPPWAQADDVIIWPIHISYPLLLRMLLCMLFAFLVFSTLYFLLVRWLFLHSCCYGSPIYHSVSLLVTRLSSDFFRGQCLPFSFL